VLRDALGGLGVACLRVLGDFGRLTLTGAEAAARLGRSLLPRERFRLRAALDELHYIGVQALPIVALIAVMMGLILAFQSAYTLEKLGAEQYVANLVAVALTRELGPVITAIVVAGRSGSSIAAEVATMKVQEELDALKVMGLDPVAFIVAPKLLAMVVAIPLLTAFADVLGILGGLACGVLALDIPAVQYLARTQEALVLKDFWSGLLKSGIFGVIIVTVGAFCGLEVTGGAAGVGRGTTRAVVLSIFLVIVADLVFTSIFYALR
jgi:phospholipid/cholesterol/gamma-HCH transport system permease protein